MSDAASASAVAEVRSFSRLVTERVGALDDRYLSRDRPLGQARVLWEIGRDGCEVGVLRARLGLDSAQLSRALPSLEADELIEVMPHTRDGRVRVAILTPTGRDEWAELDAGSDTAARRILDALSKRQQARLVEAMTDVKRLLMASMVKIDVRAPSDPQARVCLRAYVQEIEQRFGEHFDSAAETKTWSRHTEPSSSPPCSLSRSRAAG